MSAASSFRETARMAWRDLTARPLRAMLSIASFALGMAVAIVLLAMGESLRDAVGDVLRTLGEGQITVTPGRTTGIGGQRRSGRPVRLRYEDLDGIEAMLPSLAGVAPFYEMRGGGAASWRYSIPWSPVRAVGQSYLDVRRLPVVEGRWFTPEEDEEGRWVTVLNDGLRKVVFPDGEAVGQWVDWRGRKMTVVGVIRDEATFPYVLFVPYKTASHMADARYVSGLIARPAPGESWSRAVGELRRVLGGLGGFDPADPNALEIEDNSAFTSRVATVTTALHALVLVIAAVSLLLGALGVANLMVISVTERTREIGLKKALGATPRRIFLELLFESCLIVAGGGLLGMLAGAGACVAIATFRITATYTAEVRVDPAAAAVAFLGLALAGVLAGAIPARRGASLPAAETLRWE